MKHKIVNKYIRVPNGIIDRTIYVSDTFVIDYAIKHNFPSSNDLEELCDEFVGIGNIHGNKRIYRHYENLYESTRLDDIVYGAIWTNKGLLYVAKLNDKGKLELI